MAKKTTSTHKDMWARQRISELDRRLRIIEAKVDLRVLPYADKLKVFFREVRAMLGALSR